MDDKVTCTTINIERGVYRPHDTHDSTAGSSENEIKEFPLGHSNKINYSICKVLCDYVSLDNVKQTLALFNRLN